MHGSQKVIVFSHILCIYFNRRDAELYLFSINDKPKFSHLPRAKLTWNDVLVSVLLDVILLFCGLGGEGLVSAVLS